MVLDELKDSNRLETVSGDSMQEAEEHRAVSPFSSLNTLILLPDVSACGSDVFGLDLEKETVLSKPSNVWLELWLTVGFPAQRRFPQYFSSVSWKLQTVSC